MNKRLNFNNCYVLGPTGPKGIDGDKIIVERTTTLDEDMSAEVIDRVDGNIHNLEFRIPRGKSGTSNNPTYGYKFIGISLTKYSYDNKKDSTMQDVISVLTLHMSDENYNIKIYGNDTVNK